MRKVPQVGIAAVDRFEGGGDGDVVRFGVGDGVFARADVPFAPGGDDFQAGVERHEGQLKAHLVVAFAGGAVRDGIRAVLVGHIHQVLGDQRAGDRGAQQVFAFVDGAGAQQREQVIAGEFFAADRG